MGLFGAFAVHSSESCPPNNIKSREIFVEIKDKLEKNMSNNDAIRIKSFYMSVLKNKWLIISELKIHLISKIDQSMQA